MPKGARGKKKASPTVCSFPLRKCSVHLEIHEVSNFMAKNKIWEVCIGESIADIKKKQRNEKAVAAKKSQISKKVEAAEDMNVANGIGEISVAAGSKVKQANKRGKKNEPHKDDVGANGHVEDKDTKIRQSNRRGRSANPVASKDSRNAGNVRIQQSQKGKQEADMEQDVENDVDGIAPVKRGRKRAVTKAEESKNKKAKPGTEEEDTNVADTNDKDEASDNNGKQAVMKDVKKPKSKTEAAETSKEKAEPDLEEDDTNDKDEASGDNDEKKQNRGKEQVEDEASDDREKQKRGKQVEMKDVKKPKSKTEAAETSKEKAKPDLEEDDTNDKDEASGDDDGKKQKRRKEQVKDAASDDDGEKQKREKQAIMKGVKETKSKTEAAETSKEKTKPDLEEDDTNDKDEASGDDDGKKQKRGKEQVKDEASDDDGEKQKTGKKAVVKDVKKPKSKTEEDDTDDKDEASSDDGKKRKRGKEQVKKDDKKQNFAESNSNKKAKLDLEEEYISSAGSSVESDTNEVTDAGDDDGGQKQKRKKEPAKTDNKKPKAEKGSAGSSKKNKIPDVTALDFSCNSRTSSGNKWNFKISSWNVSGIRAWVEKGCLSYVHHEDPDIMCVQETKCAEAKLPEEVKTVEGYHCYWIAGDREGYSGVGLLSKKEPLSVEYGIGVDKHDNEGRVITAEYEKFYVVATYVPNSGRGLVRLDYRMTWDEDFKAYLKKLDKKKPVILCGDLNVAHKEIDLANPKTNKKTAGFTVEERDNFSALLEEDFVDSFRDLYPDKTEAYTYWSNFSNSRSRNVGWRLDYFVLSKRFMSHLCDNLMRTEVMGSDHCPITLFLHT